MFDLEPGILVIIGIGLALITIILVAVGYSMARILAPTPDPGPDPEVAEEALEEVTQEFESIGRRRDRAAVVAYLAAVAAEMEEQAVAALGASHQPP